MRRRRLTARQWAALRKGWRKTWARNPGTPDGARKARYKGRRKVLRRRRTAAKSWRKQLRGFKVVVRRKAGRRKASRKLERRYGLRRRTGRRGTIALRKPVGRGRFRLVATNPRRRRRVRRVRRTRRNPAVSRVMSARNWTSGLTGLPKNLPAIFKGKGVPTRVLAATGGALGGIVVGSLVRGVIMGAVGRVAPTLATNRIVQGVLGAAITYSGGYLAGNLMIRNASTRNAFVTGAAVAAIVNALMPGQVNALLLRLPVIGPQLAVLPGMNGYVLAPAHQGIGAYVTAPAHQGIGRYPEALAGIGYQDDALAGELGAYVVAPNHQGVGMYGQSHLDQ